MIYGLRVSTWIYRRTLNITANSDNKQMAVEIMLFTDK